MPIFNRKKYQFKESIDLVYLWVDGNDEKWQSEKKYWQNKLGISTNGCANICRFVDNHELKFSLRSVMKNAPWINNIYIITNGQIPSWLDTVHPKIKLISHRDIMPKDALPTFNSEAIETCICNIPGLSEYFLYANDDVFIHRPITPDYFFDKKGNPKVRLAKQNWDEDIIATNLYCKNVTYSANLITKEFGKFYQYEPSHNIDAYRKSYFLECKNIFKNEFDRTTYCKFRTANSVQKHIISLYMLAKGYSKLKVINIRSLDNFKTCENMYIPLESSRKMSDTLCMHKPFLVCINDNERTISENRNRLKYFLSELYPTRQAWEKHVDFQIKPVYLGKEFKTIVFAPDNKYCKYFGVVLQSLIAHSNPDIFYDVVVFDKDLSDINKQKLVNIIPDNFSLRFVNVVEYINEEIAVSRLTSKDYWSISMYYRILIPLIMRNYDKVLYCDSDVVFNDSIDELFNIGFDGKKIMACLDSISPIIKTIPERLLHITNVLNINNPELYFNSGVIMFNIPEIDCQIYKEKFLNCLNIEDLWTPDQDILNVLFANDVKFLSWKWNFQWHLPIFRKQDFNFFKDDFLCDYWSAYKNPKIIHYTTSRKPWNAPNEDLAELFWMYARQTPYYEEILFNNIKGQNSINVNTIKNLNMKRKIYFNYYRYKILSNITFGKTKEHYNFKRWKFKDKVRDIRKYSRF